MGVSRTIFHLGGGPDLPDPAITAEAFLEVGVACTHHTEGAAVGWVSLSWARILLFPDCPFS